MVSPCPLILCFTRPGWPSHAIPGIGEDREDHGIVNLKLMFLLLSQVKCNANLLSNQSCHRCVKLGIPCVVDKSHKRTTRRRYI